MSKLRAFLGDRKKVLMTAGSIGAILALVAIARRGSSSASDTAAGGATTGEQLVAGAATPYSFDGVDAAMTDSQNASAIVEQITGLTTSVANLESAVGGLGELVASQQGAGATQDTGGTTATTPPATTTPKPPKPATPKPQGTPLPRWTPPSGLAIGGPTDIKGATFAGRVKLSNGQFAPIVKYANGTSQIHPEWQKWMAANKVTKAAK